MNSFIEGIFAGFMLSLLIGPVFFKLIQTSIEKGFKTAIYMSIGILISDLTIIAFCVLGINSIVKSANFQFITGILGGIILLIFGVINFIKKIPINQSEIEFKSNSHIKAFFNGLLLNSINPSVLLFWIAIVSFTNNRFENQLIEIVLFFSGMLLTSLTSDIAKSFLAHYLKKILTLKTINGINKLIGIALGLSGIFLILKTIVM